MKNLANFLNAYIKLRDNYQSNNEDIEMGESEKDFNVYDLTRKSPSKPDNLDIAKLKERLNKERKEFQKTYINR